MTRNRSLSRSEEQLVSQLIVLAGREDLLPEVPGLLVREMSDGGMGSVRFVGMDDSRFEAQMSAIEFADSDGVTVSAALNGDQYGRLFELDVFKSDFSPLLGLPAEAEGASPSVTD